MGCNYLTGRDGDRINAVLAAAGYNFSLLLRWFEELLRVLSLILWHALLATPLHLTRCRKTFFTADEILRHCIRSSLRADHRWPFCSVWLLLRCRTVPTQRERCGAESLSGTETLTPPDGKASTRDWWQTVGDLSSQFPRRLEHQEIIKS